MISRDDKALCDIDIDRRALLKGAGFGGLTLGIGLAVVETAHGAAEAAGMVEALTGAAQSWVGGVSRDLAVKSTVFVGDLVKTAPDTKALLKLGERTTIRLGATTSLRIDRYLKDAGGEIDLGEGAMQFERTGKPASTELKFKSAYGLIAVRGTRFWAGMSRGAFGVLVGTGAVAVTGANKTVLVRAQQGTDIARPGAEPADPRPWPSDRITEALRTVR